MASQSPPSQPLPPVYGLNHVVPQQQPVSYVIVQAGAAPRKKVEYSKDNLDSVKGLTITQLVLTITIFVFHCITTSFNSTFTSKVFQIRKELDDDEFVNIGAYSDDAGTGLWVAPIVAIAAGVGIGAYRKQRKGLIIAQLVLNIFSLILWIPLLSTVSVTISRLRHCSTVGESYDRPYDYYDYFFDPHGNGTTPPKANLSTTSLAAFDFYGETLDGLSGYFHCNNAVFKAWLALDAIILLCSVIGFAITFTLFIYSSIAACSPCCCPNSLTANHQPVRYYTQPVGPIIPSVPMNQMQVQPPAYRHQVLVASQPATSAAPQQTDAGAKWESLPPEYSAAYEQNQER